MESLEFSVPYNNDSDTLEALFALKQFGNNRITEVYLSGPQEYSGSGRIVPEIALESFLEIVDRIHQEGLRVNLVLNSTCEGSEWYSRKTVASTIEYLELMCGEHGVEALTLANPLYMKIIREKLPDVEICASVLGNIDCVQRAVIYRKAGADTITPDVNINRNLKLLEEIKETTQAKLRILVNEGCLFKCPFRQFHFNAQSHVSKQVSEAGLDVTFADFFGAGTQVIREDPAQLLKSCWIRPEDLRRYGEVATNFKLACRSQLKSFVVRVATAYMGESWDGDLLDLVSGCCKRFSMSHGAYLNNKALEAFKFFETVTACGNDCGRCSYCEQLAQQMLGLGLYSAEKREDLPSLIQLLQQRQ
jgi:collagenase-like PrtC family protease